MSLKNIILSILKKVRQFFELILVTILIYMILLIPDVFLFIGNLNQYTWIRLVLNIIAGGLIAYFGYRYLVKQADVVFERLNSKKVGMSVIIFVITWLFLTFGLPAIFGHNPLTGSNQHAIDTIFNHLTNWWTLLLFSFNIVVIAPIVEEVYFRGIMFEEAKPLGRVVQILWPTLMFALVHSPSTLEQWATYLTAGSVLMVVRVVTKKLQYTIMFHSLHNLVALLS